MKLKRVIALLLLVIFIIVGYFYLVLRTSDKTVNDKFTVLSFISEKLTLEHDVLLVKNLELFAYEHIHKIVEKDANLFAGVTLLQTLRKETPIVFNNAKIFTDGVSGVSRCLLLGTT